MNKVEINLDTALGFHPVKLVIRENGKLLIDMPSDEFISLLKLKGVIASPMERSVDLCKRMGIDPDHVSGIEPSEG